MSMMQNELISIDKLEDQIIDHPDDLTKREIQNTSLDETFQNKLNARAEQIKSNQYDTNGSVRNDSTNSNYHNQNVNYQFLINKSHLDYKHRDYFELDQELSEWFTNNDLHVLELDELKNMENLNQNSTENSVYNEYASSVSATKMLEGDDQVRRKLNTLIYYSFGKYGECQIRSEQLRNIVQNNKELIEKKVYEPLIVAAKEFIERVIATDKSSQKVEMTEAVEAIYFQVLTLLYFMINVSLSYKDEAFRDYLDKTDLVSTLIKFIEHWKWNPNHSYRIRYLISMVWKLILLEMGDSSHVKACDEYLIKKYNIKNKHAKDKNKLTCSPLDYFTFREDIHDKYPLFHQKDLRVYDFDEFKSSVDDVEVETKFKEFMAINTYSNSLSNLIESPKTYKSHTVLSQLPTQPVHIATPVPSPTLMASDYMSGGEKIKRSYQINQSMPFIYPSEVKVPFAIEEADNILKSSLYESYSTKRLWEERQKFMKQERGYVSEYKKSNVRIDLEVLADIRSGLESKTTEDEEKEGIEEKDLPFIKSIERVEKFYKNNLIRLNTFIQVLVETIKSNKLDYNLNFAEWELNPETSYVKASDSSNIDPSIKSKIDFVLMSQLEVLNIKELTVKASTGIITMLIKWFKINHVMKYYYLSSILFDHQMLSVTLDYISRSFNNTNLQSFSKDGEMNEYEILVNQNKLMNPRISLPHFEFFNNCLGQFPKDHSYKFINKDLISQLPTIIDENGVSNTYIKNYNENFSFILANLLQITNKILINNISQRVFTLNELKPSELYKMILMNYENPYITKPILKILKKLIPYQGRKWKSVNMDLISQIYLNLSLSIKDNWLSGKDLESDFNNSYNQEISLRALLQFYNVRNYRTEMESLGYEIGLEDDIPLLSLGDDEDVYW